MIGPQWLGIERDMRKTIDKDVLKRTPIAFRSSRIVAEGDGWSRLS